MHLNPFLLFNNSGSLSSTEPLAIFVALLSFMDFLAQQFPETAPVDSHMVYPRLGTLNKLPLEIRDRILYLAVARGSLYHADYFLDTVQTRSHGI